MWLCIDRIVSGKVVLIGDEDGKYVLTTEAYVTLVGREPRESDMLMARVENGTLVEATYDPEETHRRAAEARAMLDKLFGKK